MGDGFVILASNLVHLYYYMDEVKLIFPNFVISFSSSSRLTLLIQIYTLILSLTLLHRTKKVIEYEGGEKYYFNVKNSNLPPSTRILLKWGNRLLSLSWIFCSKLSFQICINPNTRELLSLAWSLNMWSC